MQLFIITITVFCIFLSSNILKQNATPMLPYYDRSCHAFYLLICSCHSCHCHVKSTLSLLSIKFHSAKWNFHRKLSQEIVVCKLIVGTNGNIFFSHENQGFEFKIRLLLYFSLSITLLFQLTSKEVNFFCLKKGKLRMILCLILKQHS